MEVVLQLDATVVQRLEIRISIVIHGDRAGLCFARWACLLVCATIVSDRYVPHLPCVKYDE